MGLFGIEKVILQGGPKESSGGLLELSLPVVIGLLEKAEYYWSRIKELGGGIYKVIQA